MGAVGRDPFLKRGEEISGKDISGEPESKITKAAANYLGSASRIGGAGPFFESGDERVGMYTRGEMDWKAADALGETYARGQPVSKAAVIYFGFASRIGTAGCLLTQYSTSDDPQSPEVDLILGSFDRGFYQSSDLSTVSSLPGTMAGAHTLLVLVSEGVPSSNGMEPFRSGVEAGHHTHVDALLTGEEGVSSPRSGVPTRSCERLMSTRKMPVLDRAKLRKAALIEGENSRSTYITRQRIIRKVQKKSAHCGVKLSGGRPRSSKDFCFGADL